MFTIIQEYEQDHPYGSRWRYHYSLTGDDTINKKEFIGQLMKDVKETSTNYQMHSKWKLEKTEPALPYLMSL